MRKFLIALLLSVSMLGCATLEKSPNTAKLVTQYAVMKFAEQSSDERRVERIANVRKIAEDVKSLAANQTVSVPGLQAAVMAQVAKLGLSPADSFLASALVQVVADELAAKIGDGVISPEKMLVVSQVMDWVIDATKLIAPSP